jgi:hypothetical protein
MIETILIAPVGGDIDLEVDRPPPGWAHTLGGAGDVPWRVRRPSCGTRSPSSHQSR